MTGTVAAVEAQRLYRVIDLWTAIEIRNCNEMRRHTKQLYTPIERITAHPEQKIEVGFRVK